MWTTPRWCCCLIITLINILRLFFFFTVSSGLAVLHKYTVHASSNKNEQITEKEKH